MVRLNDAKIVAPNVLLGNDQIFYLTDDHMINEYERFGVKSSGTGFYVTNSVEKVIRLDEAVYLGSALDFIYYESVVYTLAKYRFMLNSNKRYLPQNIVLNERMAKNTREWLVSSLSEKFPNCSVILMNESMALEAESLLVFTLNSQLINSNLSNMSLFIKSQIPKRSSEVNFRTKILLARKSQVYFNLKSRKPRNARLFEWYARWNGYEVFDPGGMKFEEVLERMAVASKVISYHGGGLVNLLACNPGTRVSEIYSEWYADCFEQISASCKLKYSSFFYEMKKRPDLIRTLYFFLFRLNKKAEIKHFRIKFRDFKTILQD
jgi:hypothetical protein